jgi:hypothetical protein
MAATNWTVARDEKPKRNVEGDGALQQEHKNFWIVSADGQLAIA